MSDFIQVVKSALCFIFGGHTMRTYNFGLLLICDNFRKRVKVND